MEYISAEVLWSMLGGKQWTCPLHPKIYRILLKRAEPFANDPEIVALLCTYREAYQLSLDGNLPGALRNAFKTQAISFGCELGNIIQAFTEKPRSSAP